MKTIESVHYPNKTVNTPQRRSKDGPLVEGHIAAREGTSDQIDRNRRYDLATEKRALDHHELPRTSPGLLDVFAKRGRSNPRDRDSINIQCRGPALDLIIRFDQCR